MAFTPVQQNQFLEALAKTGVIASACRVANVSYGVVTALRKNNDDFAAAWDEALERATDSLESEARRRALEGYSEPVIHQGQMTPIWERDPVDGDVLMFDTQVPDGKGGSVTMRGPRQLVVDGVPQWLTVKKHSDPLLMFLLKANRGKFKDKSSLELSNPDGSLAPVGDTTKAARLATLMALAASRAPKAEDFEDLA